MDAVPEIEELTVCGYCKQRYNELDQSPKLLSCKHYFCLQCVRTSLSKGQELYCVHCWKRTELGDMGPESLPTYTPVLNLARIFAKLKLQPGGCVTALPTNATSSASPATTTSVASSAPKPSDTASKMVLSENCHTHAMPLALWCQTCCVPLCRACATTAGDHAAHQVKSQTEAKDCLLSEMQNELQSMNKMLTETQRLAVQQREFLLKILEACVTLKTHVEADLTSNASHIELTEARDLLVKFRTNLAMVEHLHDAQSLYVSLGGEKQRLQMRYQEMYLQCQLDDLIRNSTVAFDFQLLKQALANLQNGESVPYANSRSPATHQNPILFLANYCMSQLYSRHVLNKQINGTLDYHHHHQQQPQPPHHHQVQPFNHHHHHQGLSTLATSSLPQQQRNYTDQLVMHHSPVPMVRNGLCPLYFFNVEVNGTPVGRIVIEVRADVAPKMAKNFGLLATGEQGMGYKGCSIFQCWEGESVITGDFELNNGRGGRSVFDESFFLPDDTKLLAVRGTVGMRRTQKRHDNLGMVGSQFRIILQEMRGFTGIFGHVVEGLELVEKISTYGDTAGKPTKNILITKCGKL